MKSLNIVSFHINNVLHIIYADSIEYEIGVVHIKDVNPPFNFFGEDGYQKIENYSYSKYKNCESISIPQMSLMECVNIFYDDKPDVENKNDNVYKINFDK